MRRFLMICLGVMIFLIYKSSNPVSAARNILPTITASPTTKLSPTANLSSSPTITPSVSITPTISIDPSVSTSPSPTINISSSPTLTGSISPSPTNAVLTPITFPPSQTVTFIPTVQQSTSTPMPTSPTPTKVPAGQTATPTSSPTPPPKPLALSIHTPPPGFPFGSAMAAVDNTLSKLPKNFYTKNNLSTPVTIGLLALSAVLFGSGFLLISFDNIGQLRFFHVRHTVFVRKI